MYLGMYVCLGAFSFNFLTIIYIYLFRKEVLLYATAYERATLEICTYIYTHRFMYVTANAHMIHYPFFN